MTTHTVTVEVTQDDIDNGKRGAVKLCPFALALRRALIALFNDPALEVSVGPSDAVYRFGEGRPNWWIDFPESVRDFIKKFDTKQPVSPFAVDLTWETSE